MTVAAPTAREVLKNLDRRQQAEQMLALVSLDDAAQAAARRALSAVKPSSRIDVAVLVASVRARASAPSRASAIATITARLDGIAERLRLFGTPRGSMSPAEVLAMASDAAEGTRILASFVAGEFPASSGGPSRRSIPRVPSRRALDSDSPESRADPAPATAQRASARARAAWRPSSGPARAGFLGPRCFGPGDPGRPFGASVDYDPHAWSPDPPWVLPDELEPEEIDDDADTEALSADAY